MSRGILIRTFSHSKSAARRVHGAARTVFLSTVVVVSFFLNCGSTWSSKVVQGVFTASEEPDKQRLEKKLGGLAGRDKANQKKSVMRYHLLTFPDAEPSVNFRLIFVHHPAGESAEHYLQNWQPAAVRNQTMLLVPQREGEYGVESPGLKTFADLIADIIVHYPVDRRRIYVAGASAGALIGTWLVQRDPSFWRGAIFVAGFGFEDSLVGVPIDEGKFKSYPRILYVHGWHDTETFKSVLDGIEMLLDRGVNVQLYDYENAGHEHRPEWNKRIFEWIQDIERDDKPSVAPAA